MHSKLFLQIWIQKSSNVPNWWAGWWSTAGVGDLVRYLNCDREDLTHRPRASLLQSPGLSFLHGQWHSRTTPRLPHVVFDWVCSPASEHSCDLFPLFYPRFFFFISPLSPHLKAAFFLSSAPLTSVVTWGFLLVGLSLNPTWSRKVQDSYSTSARRLTTCQKA